MQMDVEVELYCTECDQEITDERYTYCRECYDKALKGSNEADLIRILEPFFREAHIRHDVVIPGDIAFRARQLIEASDVI
jgi:RNA polymerase subunit RPABC4/transcription elongation factor Spt4